MATVDNLLLRISAMGGRAAAAEVEGVKGSVGGLGSTAKVAGGMLGIGALAFGLKDITKAAIDFQSQQATLQNALKNTGQGAAGNMTKITDAAERLAAQGGFSPTQQIAGMTRLVSAHLGVSKAIKDNTLVTDIARQTHMDYTRVLRAVMMAEQGRTTGLSRMGIIIKPVTTAVDELRAAHAKLPPALAAAVAGNQKLTPEMHKAIAAHKLLTPAMLAVAKEQDKQATKTHAMSLLWKTFTGAAAAYSKTAAGSASDLRNQVEMLARKLGTALLPMITAVVHALSDAVNFFMKNKDAARALEIAMGALAALWAISKIAAFVGWLGKGVAIMKAWTVVTWLQSAADTVLLTGMYLLDAAMALPLATIGLIVIAIAAVIAIVVLVVTHFKEVKAVAIDVFKAIESAVVTAFNAIKSVVLSVLTWMLHAVMYFVDAFKGPFNTLAPIVVGVFNVIKDVVQHLVDWFVTIAVFILKWLTWPYRTIAQFVFDNVVTPIKNHLGAIISFLKSVWNGLTDVLTAPFKALWSIVQELIGPIQTIIGAASSLIGSLGTSTHSTSGHGTSAQQSAAAALLKHQTGGLATGGTVTGSGMFDVGEHGKERVYLPAGSAVVPNQMLGNVGAGTQLENHITLQIGAIEFARAIGYSLAKARATA